jgi:hypothetical protein
MGIARSGKTFLLQLRMYYRFYPDKFVTIDAMSLWASSYLSVKALKWIEPSLSDYFENSQNINAIMVMRFDINTVHGLIEA